MLRVAFTVAKEDLHSGDRLREAKRLILKAKKLKADIICFGECFPVQTSNPETELNGISYLLNLSKKNKVAIIFGVGTPEYNKAVFVNRGNIIGEQLKGHFFANEKRKERATNYEIFPFKKWKIGMLVCYDLFFPEPTRSLQIHGADIVFCPAHAFIGQSFWKSLATIRSMENQIPVVLSGTVQKKLNMKGPGVAATPNSESKEIIGNVELMLIEVDLTYWKKLRSQQSNSLINAWAHIKKSINGPFVKDINKEFLRRHADDLRFLYK